ncbi:MAG: methylmalonyl Co-A mutase-associated GTPase MeaB [Chloroflexi bacterium]|nr:methylmalonyl Co-A mutase-associated GTPase MeaB [Chloroflexota bacterium]MBU1750263.1 methylmalonyl Co-A mutase-associated GTPase MeaB [Chloroflexota bacterium]
MNIPDLASLSDGVLAGDRRAMARAISLVENRRPGARDLLAVLYPHSGRAQVIGVTGAAGSGKSSLVNELVLELRRRGHTVGVVAVDPTSPFSGGAILGDRIRMRDLAGDPGIFIRSMATRGALGGLTAATVDAVVILDAAGLDRVIIETVGVGQDEVDIARTAHTTIVLQVPGLGDDVQALKAGILEIADVFAVNKADLDGAEQLVAQLQIMLDLNSVHTGVNGWRAPILQTVATAGTGIPALADALTAHWDYLQHGGHGQAQARAHAERLLAETLAREAATRLRQAARDRGQWEPLVDQVTARELDPYTAAGQVLAEWYGRG